MPINTISVNRPHEFSKGEDIASDLNLHSTIYPGAIKTFSDTINTMCKNKRLPYLLASVTNSDDDNARFYDGLYALSRFTQMSQNQIKLAAQVKEVHYYVITELSVQQQHAGIDSEAHYIGSHEEMSGRAEQQNLLTLMIHTYRSHPSVHDFFLTAEKFDKGQGCNKNASLARTYYELAGERGHEESQFRIAWMFLLAEGGCKSEKNAKKYFKMVVEGRHSPDPTLLMENAETSRAEERKREERVGSCALQLAKMYRSSKDWEQAVDYYTIAGSLNPEAKYECAQMLMEKDGPITDEQRNLVLQFLREVADHDDHDTGSGMANFVKVEAQYHLAHKLYNFIQHIPPRRQSWDLTRQQWEDGGLPWSIVENARAEAQRYYEEASSHGHVEAKFELANLLFYPIVGRRNIVNVRTLLMAAAEQGHAKAQFNLFQWRNTLQMGGLSVDQGLDHKLPQDYLKSAADQKLPEAEHEWARWLENSGRDSSHEAKKGDRINDLITAISYYEKSIESWRKKGIHLSRIRETQVYLGSLTLTLSDYNESLQAALEKQIEEKIQTAVTYSTKKSGLPTVTIKIGQSTHVFSCEIEGNLEREDENDLLQSMIGVGAHKMIIKKKEEHIQKFASLAHEVAFAGKDLESLADAEDGLDKLKGIVLSKDAVVTETIRAQIVQIFTDYLGTCIDEDLQRQTVLKLESIIENGLSADLNKIAIASLGDFLDSANSQDLKSETVRVLKVLCTETELGAENIEVIVTSLGEFLLSGASSERLKIECIQALSHICERDIAAGQRKQIIKHLTEFLGEDETVNDEIIAALTNLATGRIGARNYDNVVTELMVVMLEGRQTVDPIAEALGEIAFNDTQGTPGPLIVKKVKDHLIAFAKEYEQPTCGFSCHNRTVPRKVLKKIGYNYGQAEFIAALKTGVNLAIMVAQNIPK
ncbi:MAG: TPR repeat protein [Chlamydiales bacterium]|jgi:TPR repeat protein